MSERYVCKHKDEINSRLSEKDPIIIWISQCAYARICTLYT